MSVSISKIVDSSNKELKVGETNAGFTPPFTIYGTATKNCRILLWLNKELQDAKPASTDDGKWTYKFTPKSNEIDLVAAEASYTSPTNGTFKTTYE
ncbi:hypothetical protein D3C77_431230 [compost metagenome]|jgi:hypothetical protein